MTLTRAPGRPARWTWALLFMAISASSASACPFCARAEGDDGNKPARAFAVAGGLLLAGPFVLAGVFGLLLSRTLASAGGAVKEPT